MNVAAILMMAAAAQPNLDAVESMLVYGTNEFRAGEGLVRLERNAKLDNAARRFAEHLANGGQFAHDSGGTTPELRVFQAGYTACVVFENIARHYNSAGFSTNDLAREMVQGFKNSPNHRRNMLEPDATETGVAIVHRTRNGVEDFYGVQLLARNESSTVIFRILNRNASQVSYRVNGKAFVLRTNYAREHSRCTKPELQFDDPARGRYDPVNYECFVVSAEGDVGRFPGECQGH